MKLLSRLLTVAIPAVASIGLIATTLFPSHADAIAIVQSVTFISPTASPAPTPLPPTLSPENVGFNVDNKFFVSGGVEAQQYILTWGTTITCTGSGIGDSIHVENQQTTTNGANSLGNAIGFGWVSGSMTINGGMQTAAATTSVSASGSTTPNSKTATVSFWVGPTTGTTTPLDPKHP